MHRVGAVIEYCILVLSVATLGASFQPSFARAQEKLVALVIGNDRYPNLPHQHQLERAVGDARSVAKAFAQLGFEVTRGENVGRADFNALWQRLLERTAPGDTVAFYFSGHGVKIDGLNFLLPSDVPNITYGRQEQLKRESLSVSEFLLDLRRRAPQVSLLILDACRDHPLIPPEYRSTSSARGGLARMDAPTGTFIMYSAGAGETALDRLPGNDRDRVNSVYTRNLLPLMSTPGLALPELARRLRLEVHALAATAPHVQTPAYYDGLMGRFCLAGCTATDDAEAERKAADDVDWARATAANRLDGYRAYLKARPEGKFAPQGRAHVAELERFAALWDELRTSRNLPKLRLFTDQAKTSEFGPAASVRLNELETIEASAWRKAEGRKRLASYEAFLVAWPEGFLSDLARQKIADLQAIQAEWNTIRASQDERQLEDFIFQHGWTEYGPDATAHLVALRRERARPDTDSIRTLAADEMLRALDGATIRFQGTGEAIHFATQSMPKYRPRLGKDFLRQLMKEDLAAEGAFTSEPSNLDHSRRIEGLGGIVKSKVDSTGSLFLLQMHGTERDRKDVDQKDRQFKTLQIVQDSFGYVCITTSWHSILASTKPQKIPERCAIETK